MSVQNDNTLVTKGDLKELYTDKIAPYLGGGISYYQCDRSGEELKSCYASLDSGWAATANTNVPFIKRTGEFIQPSTGLFTIPNGTKIEVVYTFGGNPGGDSTFGLYNNTDSLWITADSTDLKMIDPFIQSGYNYGSVLQVIWKNETGHDVDVAIRCKGTAQSTTLAVDRNALTIKEIGRIVDPVKYVSNNSDLQETPVGNIISYMGNSVPKHYLACDGTTYSIGTYPELEAFIIDEFGSVNYFGGDGTDTWAVPDLRGEFLRGTGTNSHENQGNGGNIGAHQDGTIFDYVVGHNSVNRIYGTRQQNNEILTYDKLLPGISGNSMVYSGEGGAQTGGFQYTSRPTNTSVQYCIKYESTYHAFFSNAAYKVSVAASVSSHSGAAIAITLDNSDIIGDASLVSGNSFIAPLDGLYLIGMNWSNNGVWEQNYMINVNGTDVYHVVGIGVTDMLQLQKGDVVTIKTSKTSAQSGRVSFALVTSNYNPTIVSADSVYSENEQMVGYWTDGRPLYQKTIKNTTLSVIAKSAWTTYANVSDLNIHSLIGASFGRLSSGGLKEDDMSDVCFWTDGTNLQANSRGESTNTPTGSLVTIKYTKTTDTASSLQIENSLLLNRPDLWVAGTEYHFGGGLYGYRKTGTTNATYPVNNVDLLLPSSVTTAYKLVNQGGSVVWNNGSWSASIPYNNPNYPGIAFPWFSYGNNALYLYLQYGSSSGASQRVDYDVWVTYKK